MCSANSVFHLLIYLCSTYTQNGQEGFISTYQHDIFCFVSLCLYDFEFSKSLFISEPFTEERWFFLFIFPRVFGASR